MSRLRRMLLHDPMRSATGPSRALTAADSQSDADVTRRTRGCINTSEPQYRCACRIIAVGQCHMQGSWRCRIRRRRCRLASPPTASAHKLDAQLTDAFARIAALESTVASLDTQTTSAWA